MSKEDIELAKWDKIQGVILAPLKSLVNNNKGFKYTLIDLNHRASIYNAMKRFDINLNNQIYTCTGETMDDIPVEFKESILVVNNVSIAYVFNEYMLYYQNIDYIKEIAKVLDGESSAKIKYKQYQYNIVRVNFSTTLYNNHPYLLCPNEEYEWGGNYNGTVY